MMMYCLTSASFTHDLPLLYFNLQQEQLVAAAQYEISPVAPETTAWMRLLRLKDITAMYAFIGRKGTIYYQNGTPGNRIGLCHGFKAKAERVCHYAGQGPYCHIDLQDSAGMMLLCQGTEFL
jgi:hypothetical protein